MTTHMKSSQDKNQVLVEPSTLFAKKTNFPLIAELELERDKMGTYFCVVKNSEGKSNPCEIHIDFQNIGILSS